MYDRFTFVDRYSTVIINFISFYGHHIGNLDESSAFCLIPVIYDFSVAVVPSSDHLVSMIHLGIHSTTGLKFRDAFSNYLCFVDSFRDLTEHQDAKLCS